MRMSKFMRISADADPELRYTSSTNQLFRKWSDRKKIKTIQSDERKSVPRFIEGRHDFWNILKGEIWSKKGLTSLSLDKKDLSRDPLNSVRV